MSINHKNITEGERHLPEGFESASNSTVLSKDAAGNLEFVPKNDIGGSQGPVGPAGPPATINNVVVVQKTPDVGQFSTIEAALTSITTASASNWFVIRVGPGIYQENQIVLKSFINVVGDSEGSTVIEPVNPNTPLIIGASSCYLDRFTIRNVTNSTAIETTITGGVFFCSHLLLKDNLLHVDVKTGAPTRSKIDMFRCTMKGISNRCIQIISTSSVEAKCVLGECIVEQEGTGDGIFVSGILSNLIINGGEVDGENIGTDGLIVEDGGMVESFGTEFERWQRGIVTNNVGVFPHLVMGSILFEANSNKDIQLDHVGTIGVLSGIATETKVLVDPAAPVSLFYVDPAENGMVSVGKFKIGDRHNQLIDASKLIQKGFSLGLQDGGELSVVTGLQLQINAGIGFFEIMLPNHHLKEFSWITQNVTIPDNTSSYIFFDNAGVLQTQLSVPGSQHMILLGRAAAKNGSVVFLDNSPIDIMHHGNRIEKYLRSAVGPLYASGSIVTENATPFKLDISLGDYNFGTENFLPSGGVGVTFSATFRDGLGDYSFLNSSTVAQSWDNNSGILTPITAGKFAKHSLYLVGEGILEKYFLVYGQQEFTSLVLAQGGNIPTPPISFIDSVVLIATIIVDNAGANIVTNGEIRDERPVIGFKASGVSAASDHGNLTGLTGDDHQHYVLANGTRPMDQITINGPGNINLGATESLLIDGKTNPRNTSEGIFKFLHKPIIPTSRVLNMEIDANNQNNTMGLVVNYVATGISSSNEAMVIRNNIDTANSTGGDISSSRTSKFGDGLSSVSCTTADPGVDPIIQNKGIFSAITSAFIFDGTLTDITSNLSNPASNIQLFINNNNQVYIGETTKFGAIEVILSILASNSIAPIFEYSTGGNTWATFGPSDSTNGFKNNAIISWNMNGLAGWVIDDVSTSLNKFWIRITRTAATLTTPPTEKTIKKTIITKYIWDLNGNISANGLNLDGSVAVTGTVDGRDVATDGAKLDGITSGANVINPMTTQGDVIYGGTAGVQTRLPKGLVGEVLTMNAGATAPEWKLSGLFNQITGHSFGIQEVHNFTNSVGVLSGFGFTDNLDGTISIAIGEVFIKSVDLPTGDVLFFTSTFLASLALVDLTKNYIYVQYNAGTPNIISSITKLVDARTNVLLGTVYRSALDLHIDISSRRNIIDHTAQEYKRLEETEVTQVKLGSGSLLGTNIALANSVTISAGVWWKNLNNFPTVAFDSSGADTFDTYLMGIAAIPPAPQTWTKSVAPVSALDVLSYRDPTTGTLLALVAPIPIPIAPTYSPRWIYQESNGRVSMVFGDGYLSIRGAENEPQKPRPPELADALLIGMHVVATTGIVSTIQLAGVEELIYKENSTLLALSVIGVPVDIIDMQTLPPAGTYIVEFNVVTDDSVGKIGALYDFGISQAATPATIVPIVNGQRPAYVSRSLFPITTHMMSKITFDGTETFHITATYSDPQAKGPSITSVLARNLILKRI